MTSVCALVPHFACEPWLAQALESLLAQTRPPDAIVVVDDASAQPPVDIVRAYPGVTLLTAQQNCGPYRLVQSVIDTYEFDAYLFQDADDWSAPDRLEVLLAAAEREGAELVGSHEVRVLVDEGDLVPVRYPLDVNRALREDPASFPLLHPTSLVARTLVQRVGGFATGMRFSGDGEFLRRAGWAGRVVNADHFGYFRRKRRGSLTMSQDTGLQSPQRRAVHAELAGRAMANAARVARGQRPDLHPYRQSRSVPLHHVTGPRPGHRPAVTGWSAPSADLDASTGPVFVLGPPRSGARLVGSALGQHPAFTSLIDGRWLARLAVDVARRATDDSAPAPAALGPQVAQAVDGLAATGDGAWVAAGGEVTEAAWALAQLYPDSRFIVVTRELPSTVAAVLASPTEEGAFHTHDLAVRRWIRATRTCLDLEAALGSDRVHRVRHADLIGDTPEVLGGVLAWLGVDSFDGCLRPFIGVTGQPVDATVADVSDELAAHLVEQIAELTDRVAQPAPLTPDACAASRLDQALRDSRAGAAQPDGESLVEKVRAVVTRVVPADAVVVVAGKGDPRLVDLDGRDGWHFPQVPDGRYAGHHPADSAAAVSALERLRARGAEYFVLPASQFWWLDHYQDLGRHLERHHRVVAYQEDSCIVYALTGSRGDVVVLPHDLVAPAEVAS